MQAMIGKLLINVVPAVIMTISLIQMSSINFVGAFGRGISTRRNAFQYFTQKKTLISSRPSLSSPLWSAKDDHGQEESNDHQNSSSSSSSSIARPSDVLIVDQMPPPLPIPLKHKYYLLRHGQSEGNVEGVISSCRSLKYSSKHGLTPLGYQQGYDSAKFLLELIQQQSQTTSGEDQDDGGRNTSRIFFYSSPFARAKQTAQACIDGLLTLVEDQDSVSTSMTPSTIENGQNNSTVLNLKQNGRYLDIQTNILLEDGLMERYFGQLDGLPLSTYAYVWPEDKKDVTFTGRFHVESVAAVATRLREVILEIEQSDLHRQEEGDDIIVLTSHADVLQILQLYASGMDNVGEFSSYRFGNGEVRFMGRTTDTLPEPSPLEVPKDLPVL